MSRRASGVVGPNPPDVNAASTSSSWLPSATRTCSGAGRLSTSAPGSADAIGTPYTLPWSRDACGHHGLAKNAAAAPSTSSDFA